MAKTKAANTDELVKQALVKIATADSSLRLSGKGDYPAVFPSTAGANKSVIDRLKDQAKPLVAETGKGKALAVTLTAAGFSRVAESIPEDKVGAAAKALAGSLPAAEQVEFLQEFLPKVPAAAPELEPLLADAVRRHEAEAAERVGAERRRAERAEASRAAFQRCLDHLTRLQAGRVEELKSMLLAAGGAVPETVGRRVDPPPPVPETDDDRDFRRDVIGRLVSAWLYHTKRGHSETATALERALQGVSGVASFGVVGEEVPFDGRVHECGHGVSDGAMVRVTRPGWALEDDPGPPIQRALVE